MSNSEQSSLSRYYQFHSRIYDSTRWTFLFGRSSLHQGIPFTPEDSFRILEIGCGTGTVIQHFRKHFPKSHITGLDLSREMLHTAKKKIGPDLRVEWKQQAFGVNYQTEQQYDIIIMSYALSMIRKQWSDIGIGVNQHLKNGGRFILLDFWSSKHDWFKKWMRFNHVTMEAELPDWLSSDFNNEELHIRKAYAGLWKYVKGVWIKDK